MPRRCAQLQQRRGFTLIDLMVALAVLALLTVTVMPTSTQEGGMKLVSAATILATDIEYAQSATLANPEDHTAVIFDADGGGYYLALVSDPLVPIARPGGSGDSYAVRFGEGRALTLDGVGVQEGALVEPIEFDAFGSLMGNEDRTITLFTSLGVMDVNIRQSTGSVSIEKP